MVIYLSLCFFFNQKTAYGMRISGWSSDVCSSDRQGEKAARFIHGVADGAEGAAHTDEVQEIAVLAGRGVGPLAHRARTGERAVKADIETAPLAILDVADEPVAPGTASVGEIVAADVFGVRRQMPREDGGRMFDHGAQSGRAHARTPVTTQHLVCR